MDRNAERTWTWRLGRLFASLAKKLHYPALATIPISAAILSRVAAVNADQTLGDAAQLVARGTGPLPVIDDDGRPVGVVTRGALALALVASGPRGSIAQASSSNVLAVDPSTPAEEVLARLRAWPDAVALVVDRGSPVGMISADELARYLDRHG